MSATNLLNAVTATARHRGQSTGMRVLGEQEIPYERLLGMSAWLGGRIPTDGDGPPPAVLIAASEPLPTMVAFFAALGVGARPLILPAPKAMGGLDAFLLTATQAARRFGGRAVLALEQDIAPEGCRLPDVAAVLPLPVGADGYGVAELSEVCTPPGEVAFLQLTSASTGDAKLVAVTHANVLANLTAIGQAVGGGAQARVASWLPLYHDMGLVGAALFSFLHGCPLLLMKPAEFIGRPGHWIRALSDFRATDTAAPTFGYEYAARVTPDRDLEGIDLSGLRHAVVGAEPIRHDALQSFHDRFGPYGFRADSFVPSYGMAESTLGGTMATGSAPRYAAIDLAGIAVGQRVPILDEGEIGAGARPPDQGVAVFSVGSALAGMNVSILSDEGEPLDGDAVLGEIALCGSSVAGYLDPDSGQTVPFPGGRLPTGDLGFVHAGALFVVERKKHVIIRRGQNFLAAQFEERVARILGCSPHQVIVLDTDIYDPDSVVVALIENVVRQVEFDAEQRAALRALELPLDQVLLARRRIIPRTTSGKKKYHLCRQLLAAQSLPVKQVLRV
jgi:acyl-CoA synthetase (AMP-forming)/AMP-acid ligase II